MYYLLLIYIILLKHVQLTAVNYSQIIPLTHHHNSVRKPYPPKHVSFTHHLISSHMSWILFYSKHIYPILLDTYPNNMFHLNSSLLDTNLIKTCANPISNLLPNSQFYLHTIENSPEFFFHHFHFATVSKVFLSFC